jgi:hypothetical protein
MNPVAFELEEIVVDSASDGDRVVIEIEALNTYDMSVGALSRYPSRGAMDILGSGGRRALNPPFKVYNTFGAKIVVSVVTVPGYADSQALEAAETVIDVLIGAASDFAFRDSPVLSAMSSSILSGLSQQALDALRGGRVMTSGPTDTGMLSLTGFVPGNGFSVSARSVCD